MGKFFLVLVICLSLVFVIGYGVTYSDHATRALLKLLVLTSVGVCVVLAGLTLMLDRQHFPFAGRRNKPT